MSANFRSVVASTIPTKNSSYRNKATITGIAINKATHSLKDVVSFKTSSHDNDKLGKKQNP